MAKEKVDKDVRSPDTLGSVNKQKKDKRRGFLFGLLTILLVLVVVTGVVGGVFYIVISNNTNGLAEKYRNEIRRIPVLNQALPEAPAEYDPEDPINLTTDELILKYNELRKERDGLKANFKEAENTISQLQPFKDEIEALRNENTTMKKELEEDKAEFEEDKKTLDRLMADGDKEGYKEYFNKIDREMAQIIYKEIMENEKANEEAKKFAQVYESMDPGACADIFQQLGNSKIDLVVLTLKNMKKDTAAEILSEMDQKYAAEVTEKLSKEFGIKF